MKKFTIYIILISSLLCGCTGGDRMLAELERLEEQNRSDVPFTSDSAALRLVNYYDRWYRLPTTYNRNLSMRAYYMLGSAYRDMGEAPAALHYYDIATRQVDTLRADSATSATLFRIYGQMALIYGWQNLPYEKLEALEKYGFYALIAKDTLNYILGIEHKTGAYYELDDTLNIYAITEKARRLYLELGQKEKAARVYPTAIYVSLLNKNYVKAHKYMKIFEQESGLFDEDGNIEKGREQYYYSKGLYALGTNYTDSAEYFFRKLITHGYTYEAYRGLLSVYRMKKDADSIAKYSNLFEDAVLRWETSRQDEAIIQSSAMYRYERNQSLAEQETRNARLSHYVIVLLLAIGIISSLLVFLKLNHIKRCRLESELEFRKLVEEHMTMQIKFQNQTEQISLYRQEVVEREEQLKKEEIVVYFHVMSQGGYNGKLPAKKDWEKLISAYRRHMPHMFARMQVANLSMRETYTSILTHLNFSASDILVLLDTSKQIVSNTKLSSKKKMFGENISGNLEQCLKKCAYLQA